MSEYFGLMIVMLRGTTRAYRRLLSTKIATSLKAPFESSAAVGNLARAVPA